MSTTHDRTVSDLAADSPLSYDELRALHGAGTLGARLAILSPRERVGAAAVIAERQGRDLSTVLDIFGRAIEAAQALAAYTDSRYALVAGLPGASAEAVTFALDAAVAAGAALSEGESLGDLLPHLPEPPLIQPYAPSVGQLHDLIAQCASTIAACDAAGECCPGERARAAAGQARWQAQLAALTGQAEVAPARSAAQDEAGNTTNNDETPRPIVYPPVKGGRMGEGVLISDELLRRRMEQRKPPIQQPPKGPVKSA